jgi:hypothetical protein
MTHREEVMAWAALRERPKPVLIKARPATANGTSRTKTKQSANVKR